jgi:ubiquitin C-terminal hydrolase
MSGIPNLGNTCYASACLQGLRHCRRFRSFVKAYSDSMPSQLVTLLDRFYDILEDPEAVQERVSVVAHALLRMLSLKDMGDQGDVHEFFLRFVDLMSKETALHKAPQVRSRHVYDEPFDPRTEALTRSLDARFFSRNLSYCEWLFSGQTVTLTRCVKCDACRTSSEDFSCVFVHPEDRADSFEACLARACKAETLDGVACERCGTKGDHERLSRMFRTPPILLFVTMDPGRIKDVPPTFDVSRYCWRPSCDESSTYDLRSAACYAGDARSGHYVSLCKDDEASWVLYDDNRTRKVPEGDVQAVLERGYVFVFERS